MTYITRSPSVCVECRQALGQPHAASCEIGKYTIRRAQ